MEKVDLFSNGYYKSNRILMTVIGIWPELSSLQTIFIRVIMFALLFSTIIPQYAFLVRKCNNLDDMIFGISAQIAVLIGFSKYYFVAVNIQRVKTVLDQIQEDWHMLRNSPAINTVHKYAAKGRFGTRLYIVMIFSSASFFSIVPLKQGILDKLMPLNESRPKIFMLDVDYTLYGIDANELYYPTLFHSYFTGMIVMNMIVSVDTFVLIIIEHCCGLFECVGVLLEGLELPESSNSHCQIIDSAIVVHHRAISLAEFIETSFTMMYAFVVLICMILISITGLELAIKIDEIGEVIRFGAFVVGQLTHLLFMSLPGQKLLDHSARVSEAVSNWCGTSLNARKLISVMLMRSMKPLTMTAGGFYIMNLENFANVLRTSFSYFTVILSNR
ncbi:odorant receptor 4-like isoform X2 [Diachasmimorpha longicaudata]|uniref:odorant receptor 4-like isoform X2 n=1 Tax=Diachasmimorpha longicaudata TaxID=58733 RepID=UPI0030B86C3C